MADPKLSRFHTPAMFRSVSFPLHSFVFAKTYSAHLIGAPLHFPHVDVYCISVWMYTFKICTQYVCSAGVQQIPSYRLCLSIFARLHTTLSRFVIFSTDYILNQNHIIKIYNQHTLITNVIGYSLLYIQRNPLRQLFGKDVWNSFCKGSNWYEWT